MKKIYLLLFTMLSVFLLNAQTITIGAGTTVSGNLDNGNPIYRSSATSGFGWSISGHVYTATQLSAIPAGSTITAVAFKKTSTSGTAVGKTAALNIYMNNSSLSNLSVATTRGTVQGLSNVYTNATQTIPATAGFITFTLTTPFVYTGGSLEVYLDWNIGTQVSSGISTGSFLWEYSTGNATQTIGTSTNAIMSGATVLGSAQARSYNAQITYTPASPCTGTPNAGSITSSTSVCVGSSVTLSNTGSTAASGLTYQWEQSIDNGVTWTNAIGGSGANATTYATPPLTSNVQYRFVVTCTSSALSSTSNISTITIVNPAYAAIPYTEDFETWINGCGTSDIPTNSWRNSPISGNNSWRRDDQGTTAAWGNPTLGAFAPVFTTGAHSARFHAYQATGASIGNLDFYVDCSSGSGTSQLTFDFILNVASAATLGVFLSTDGGTTFIQQGANLTLSSTWVNKLFTITSSSANTIIRLSAVSDFGDHDIGIDNFKIIPPPSCLAPLSLSTTFISGTGATHNWTAPSPAPSSGYEWAVTTSNIPPSSGTPIALLTTNSSGLASSTVHYLHVRSNCGVGTYSSWSTSSFTTLCAANNIPYLMPITAVTTPALPLCTTIEDIGSLPNTWASFTTTTSAIVAAYTLPVMAYVYNSSNPANDWLYTNALNLVAGISYTLKYKYSNDLGYTGSSYPEAMKVAIGASNTSASMTTILANYPSINVTIPQLANNIFTVPSSGTYFIGFQAYSVADQNILLLDDVEVIVTPTCAPVTGLAVATTPTTASLSWATVAAAANGYEYVVDAIATSPTGAGTPIGTSSVSVPGTYILGTTYYAHVRSICSVSDFSPWTNLLFTPPPACLIASDYLTPINGATVPYQPNVLISWNNVPSATSYDIYVQVGVPPTVATTLLGNLPASAGATTGAFLNTALPATQYVWYVVGKNTGGGALGCGLPRTYTTAAAPPIPTNDDCGTAISLTVNANDLCAITTAGTTLGATASTETAPSCNATGTNDDVWYTFTATGATHIINVTGVSAGAVMSSQVYSGACGSLALVTGGCSSTFPYTITGLTASTIYTVRVNTVSAQPNNQSNFVICVGAPPSAPPLNDDATGAITLSLGAGCTSLYSNALATASATEVFPSCSGVIQSPVWFKFVAPASGAVRVTTDIAGGTFTDSKLAVFSATDPAVYTTFSIISCDDDGGSAVGSGFLSVVYATGLIPGNTYYVAVDKYSASTTSGTFCITVDELNNTMLATANTCASSFQSPSSNSATGYTGWIPLMDAASKLVAMVQQPTGAAVSDFTVAQNINTASIRTTGSVPYLNRSYRIASTQTNVNVQFFFLLSELAALTAVDGTVNLTNLGGSKQTETVGTCNDNFVQANGAFTGFNQIGNTSANGVGFITITTPSFSNFYLHKQGAVLPSSDILTGSKQGNSNLLDWKVSCAGFAEITMVLERSKDRRTFAPLQQQVATSARCDQNFTYVDASPLAGINYYRIKIITPQGDVRYTDIVALINKSKGFELISLAPNPVKNSSILSLSSAIAGKVDITVIDFAGKTVSKEMVKVIAGNNPITMDLAKLAAGTYTIIAKNADGEMKTSRFVKY